MDEIQVGSIVELGGSKYEVVRVGVHASTGKVYPLSVYSLTPNGDHYPSPREIKGDSSWSSYNWVVLTNGGKPDPKARIIAKIKYLERKFKRNQEIKKRQKEFDEAVAFQAGQYLTTAGTGTTITGRR